MAADPDREPADGRGEGTVRGYAHDEDDAARVFHGVETYGPTDDGTHGTPNDPHALVGDATLVGDSGDLVASGTAIVEHRRRMRLLPKLSPIGRRRWRSFRANRRPSLGASAPRSR